MPKISGSGQACSNRARSAGLDESATMGVTFTPYLVEISVAAFSKRSFRRAVMTNSTPASANRSAVARPMPALPPAMMAFLPFICKSIRLFLLIGFFFFQPAMQGVAVHTLPHSLFSDGPMGIWIDRSDHTGSIHLFANCGRT